MATIHPTAIVDSRADLADDVQVGAYSVIKGFVTVGAGTVIQEHCHIHGHTIIGRDCCIGPAAYVGLPPQHLKYRGETTFLVIGDGVTIRETVTIHRAATPGLDHATRVGSRCYLMGAAHVGHDSVVGEDVIIANAVLLAGHVSIGSGTFVGGGASIHQFVRCGRLAVLGGNARVNQDVPPFAAVIPAGLKAYNAVGCRRAGLPREVLVAIRAAFRCIHTNRSMRSAIAEIRANVPDVPEVREILQFISFTRRGIIPSWRNAVSVDAGE